MNDRPAACGLLYVVSAASGAGKTSLVNALTAAQPGVSLSISFTTRPIRAGEREGVDYHFIGEARFEAMIAQSAFMEFARVFGHYYGTSREWVESHLTNGTDVVLEIDWQGARQVRKAWPQSIGIFILPPSYQDLEHRLKTRGMDDEEVIRRRMLAAVNEMSHYSEYDYLLVNDDFDRALGDLRAILRAGRLGSERQRAALHSLVRDLLEPKIT
ncbi:MAG: guanylate kinase [Pseudomonadota bacterium]|nr:guanylate kinase [Pseudomonadota bacterium]